MQCDMRKLQTQRDGVVLMQLAKDDYPGDVVIDISGPITLPNSEAWGKYVKNYLLANSKASERLRKGSRELQAHHANIEQCRGSLLCAVRSKIAQLFATLVGEMSAAWLNKNKMQNIKATVDTAVQALPAKLDDMGAKAIAMPGTLEQIGFEKEYARLRKQAIDVISTFYGWAMELSDGLTTGAIDDWKYLVGFQTLLKDTPAHLKASPLVFLPSPFPRTATNPNATLSRD